LEIRPESGKYNTKKRFQIVSETLFVMVCIARNSWWLVNKQDADDIANDKIINQFLLLKSTSNGKDFKFYV
jgi:hypothetical protein